MSDLDPERPDPQRLEPERLDPERLDPERQRLAAADAGTVPWRAWGPYLAERAWGTVREDYSADGDAWGYFPHDHARSRAYRWNDDGLAGICDEAQTFCLALALWNGADPILKERAFGLTGPQGNHGEDAKDYWWHLDATPTSSWLRWRYHYPQAPFPYADLVDTNAARDRNDPEYELVDTGVFDGGWWQVDVTYAKETAYDVCLAIDVTNHGSERSTLHVLPTLWWRNTWSWGQPGEPARPHLAADGARLVATHERLGTLVLVTDDGSGSPPTSLVCDNDTNTQRLYGQPGPEFPKDGINDHVVHGAASVNPQGTGTKGALWHQLTVEPGETAHLRGRLTLASPSAADGFTAGELGAGWEQTMAARAAEADAFYAPLLAHASPDDVAIARHAFAGLLWAKQFFHFDVDRWLDGDPAQPAPPPQRLTGRNSSWRHLNNHDVISMPDSWEYPWYAGWDLAFHCVALAHVDPEFAKSQLLLLLREWYMHPSGQLPAYEWDFGDVNPPVHAWAALRVFAIDGGTDFEFLERVFHKLLLNFTWWVNRKDAEGNNVFEGGFLGLDNIGPFDRSKIPVAGHLEQSDGTAWMAGYCLDLLEMAMTLALHDTAYTDVATKFFEHFAYIAAAIVDQGLWDEDDGFFYDVLHLPSGAAVPLKARSMVGLLPLCAVLALTPGQLQALPDFAARMRWFLANKPKFRRGICFGEGPGPIGEGLLSVVEPEQLHRVLARMLDPAEFLSDHGVRALSAWHRDHPLRLDVEGVVASVDYEPGESTTGLFGGNSNWRGPVWMPVNYLLVSALRRFDGYLGADFTVPLDGGQVRLAAAADAVADRLIGLFRRGTDGRRPVLGDVSLFQDDERWRDLPAFFEYFHGDTGAGLGASHQTGWTALVANLVMEQRGGGAA